MSDWTIIHGSHFRKIVGHGAVYFLASLLTKAIGAILLPIYTRVLTPDEYAAYSNLVAVAGLAGVFISLFLDNAYARLLFDTENRPERIRTLLSTLLWFMLGWGVVTAGMIAWGIRGLVQEPYGLPALPFALVVVAVPLLRQYRALVLAHYRAQHRSGRVAGASVVFVLVNAGTAVSLLGLLTLKAGALLWGMLAGEAVASLLATWWLLRDRLLAWRFSMPLMKEALIYSLGLLPLTAASWASGYADRLLITWFGDQSGSGVYSVAFEIGNLVNLATIAIFAVYGPMVMAMLKTDRAKNIPRIEAFQSFYMHFLIGAALFLSIFTPEIYEVLVDERYHAGMAYVPIIAFAFIFAGARKLHATLMFYHKKTLLISGGGILQAAVTIAGNFALIPWLGPAGSAWSKLAAGVAVAVYFHLLTRHYEPLRIDRRGARDTLLICAVVALVMGGAMFGVGLNFWPLLAVKVGLLALAMAWTWWSSHGHALRRTLRVPADGERVPEEAEHDG